MSVDIDLGFVGVADAARQRRPDVLKDSHAMQPSPVQ